MTESGITALVGSVGGAGTTRLALEFGATLARGGRSVLVVDAAFSTQGLSTTVSGRIDTDVTAVLTDDRPLEEATTGLDVDWADEEAAGTIAVAPARAPFERFSRAMTATAGRRLGPRLSAASEQYDHVLVDVPPVAGNHAVAAVTAADRVLLVVPDSQRGVDALPRTRDRLLDVNATVDSVVTNRASEPPRVDAADAIIPESETTALPDAPVAVARSEFATAITGAVEATLGVDLGLGESESSSLSDYLTR